MSDSDTKPEKREVAPDETIATSSKKRKKTEVVKEPPPIAIENDTITLPLDSTKTKQIYNNVLSSSKGPAGCLNTDNSPSTFILAMVTNDVSHMTSLVTKLPTKRWRVQTPNSLFSSTRRERFSLA